MCGVVSSVCFVELVFPSCFIRFPNVFFVFSQVFCLCVISRALCVCVLSCVIGVLVFSKVSPLKLRQDMLSLFETTELVRNCLLPQRNRHSSDLRLTACEIHSSRVFTRR